MSICNRMIANLFRKHLKPFNITNSQLSILFVIIKGTAINQKKIADYLHLEKSTVNRNLDRLFQKKYIFYKRDACLSLTPKGKAFLNKVIPSWEAAMEEANALLHKNGVNALNLVLEQLNDRMLE